MSNPISDALSYINGAIRFWNTQTNPSQYQRGLMDGYVNAIGYLCEAAELYEENGTTWNLTPTESHRAQLRLERFARDHGINYPKGESA